MHSSKVDDTLSIFRCHGGVLRTSKLLDLGVHPRLIYQMRDDGIIAELSRGVFGLPENSGASESDLIAVSKRVPEGVICLVSALSFHKITTKTPDEVFLAIPRGRQTPVITHPTVRVFRFSGKTILAGVQTHKIGELDIKVFSPEKTVADCFKFRNKIGLDVAIEGLKMCLAKKGSRHWILVYARLCRVEKVIMPYLEAIS